MRTPLMGASNARGMKKLIFDQYLALSPNVQTIKDTATVTMKGEYLANRTKLSNGAIFNDLDQPLTQF